jgi:hypothetical protein
MLWVQLWRLHFHVPPVQGDGGYFALAIALIVAALVTHTLIVVALYWRGVRRIWLLFWLITVCLAIFALASAGFGLGAQWKRKSDRRRDDLYAVGLRTRVVS